jgi:PD-(D/E)XK endonuclease
MRRRKGPPPGRNQRPAQALPTRATPNAKTPFEREQTTKRRGEISELAFALAAARQGFGISRPYGDSERYDIILDPSHFDTHVRPRLVRVQVKSSTFLHRGFYHVAIYRRMNGLAVPYSLAEIDFIAAYVIPEDSWFFVPLPHVLGQMSLLFRPGGYHRPHAFDRYREAWHSLREPDGLEFA